MPSSTHFPANWFRGAWRRRNFTICEGFEQQSDRRLDPDVEPLRGGFGRPKPCRCGAGDGGHARCASRQGKSAGTRRTSFCDRHVLCRLTTFRRRQEPEIDYNVLGARLDNRLDRAFGSGWCVRRVDAMLWCATVVFTWISGVLTNEPMLSGLRRTVDGPLAGGRTRCVWSIWGAGIVDRKRRRRPHNRRTNRWERFEHFFGPRLRSG